VRQHSSRATRLLVATALLLGLVVAAAFIPVPYVELSPGPTFNTLGKVGDHQVIEIKGRPTYPTSGALDAVTVYEYGAPGTTVTLLQAMRGWLDPAVAMVPRNLLYPPNTSASQIEQEASQEMVLSQNTAVGAAQKYLGYDVTPVLIVQTVLAGEPADGLLNAGDRILAVDGVQVHTVTQVRDAISNRHPGDDVTITVLRKGEKKDVVITTQASPADPQHAVIGILPGVIYVGPVRARIKLGSVGGPSAGMMFSLGIIDLLTPGELTDGAHIAGTGTISINGRVGPIGGIIQKMHGARGSGATVFLAPATNCDEVVGNVPSGLQVVKVSTLSDAVDSLEKLAKGDTNLPTCTAS
jgi:PDZ domain-containing protein